MLALVDCNNFYVSCERVFAPGLNGKPVVVLSNNDGCVISRSQEAKDLGIKMGDPYFKEKRTFSKYSVKVFSSNYPLYADFSDRVMKILSMFTPELEIYSIDEGFLSLKGITCPLKHYAAEIKKKVYDWTGIPVSVGIAKTKVLAKIANELAKNRLDAEGTCDLSSLSESEIDGVLEKFPVNDIWGIGRRYGRFLSGNGIDTALKLKETDKTWIRRNLTVAGERIARELSGISCLGVESGTRMRKEISCSRSFGTKVVKLEHMKEAVSSYITVCSEKLRAQGCLCRGIYVFVSTGHFNENGYSKGSYRSLAAHTADTSELISRGHEIVDSIFLKGKRYAKAGVVLSGITAKKEVQPDLFEDNYRGGKKDGLMSSIDAVNGVLGKGAVRYASDGIERTWRMSQKLLSPRYTTSWDLLAKVKA